MIKHSDLSRVRVTRKALKAVDRALTPSWVIEKEEFEEPKIITARYFSFNHLVLRRTEIRDLKLMPLKEKVLHETYNALSRQELFVRIKEKIGTEKMALIENEYPYQLPKDTLQFILWVPEDGERRESIVKFLARVMKVYGLDDLDVIVFERSFVSKSKYVKRSFPFMRHVHVWIRRKHGSKLA